MPTKLCLPSTDNRSKGTIFRLIHKEKLQKRVYNRWHRSVLRYWQTRTHCCGHIVAHDVSHVAPTGKHLLRTQNVSDQNQKHFLCPGHKICIRNKCCARGQTGKHLCRQQCVRKNVSSFASTFISLREIRLPDVKREKTADMKFNVLSLNSDYNMAKNLYVVHCNLLATLHHCYSDKEMLDYFD